MKRIEIIPIAERKLQKRAIRREWVSETIMEPMQVVEGYGGRKVAQKKQLIDNKEYLLRVVYEETDEAYTVVTAYLTSQVSRYWREDR
jgi:hypothetical protein